MQEGLNLQRHADASCTTTYAGTPQDVGDAWRVDGRGSLAESDG